MAQPDKSEERPYRLIAMIFDDMWKADEARAALRRMAGDDHLLEIQEAAIIVKQYDGKIRVTQDQDIVAKDQHIGHIAGILAGFVTGTMPFILAGTIAGKVIGQLTDNGVTDKFAKEVGAKLDPGRSALIVAARSDEERRGKVMEKMHAFHPTIIQSDLPPDVQAEIEAAVQKNAAS